MTQLLDICTIGHITLDKVVTTKSTRFMPGGTSYYFSKALRSFDVNYALITAVGKNEENVLEELQSEAIRVYALPSEHSVFFENIYSENQNHRDQNVLQTAAPFRVGDLPEISAGYFHLGPLLDADINAELIIELASKGLVSLDVQGCLRYVKDRKVYYHDWQEKRIALPHVRILKANDFEMEAITGEKDIFHGARALADMGVKEVIITLGDKGSVIYADSVFYSVPAYVPNAVTDATGCGDTYMAGYLYKKAKGASIVEAGRFGAAMATLKIENSGPFSGNLNDVTEVIQNRQAVYFDTSKTPGQIHTI